MKKDDLRLTTHDSRVVDDSRLTSHEIAISVRNLSKKYHLYDSPSHRLKEALHPFRKKFHKDFWALQDVSFEVKKGECIGIIGKNGSGKSTLLQMLCGVLQPSSGEIIVNGKVSALLELGAGFNPEFTGKDNVYMNGALMGFTREEMDERFPAIADFADIGDFIYQPVKTYSSGMYVRLAFAAAISIEPEILVVDEALAVGDTAFQTKCLKQIQEMRKTGITIILVTHDMMQVNRICNRAILLREGAVHAEGVAEKVIEQYLTSTSGQSAKNRMGTGSVEITSFEIVSPKPSDNIQCGEAMVFRIDYHAKEKIRRPVFTLGIFLAEGLRVSAIDTSYDGLEIDEIEGTGSVEIAIPTLLLMPNVYFINVGIWDSKVEVPYDWIRDAMRLTVKGKHVGYGSIYIPHEWNLNGVHLPIGPAKT
jgi:ABC-type polysaccharide/polyol phosphate transport system ATPase subunit